MSRARDILRRPGACRALVAFVVVAAATILLAALARPAIPAWKAQQPLRATATSTTGVLLTRGDVFVSISGGKVLEFDPNCVPDATTQICAPRRTLSTGQTGEDLTGSAFDSAGEFYVTDFGRTDRGPGPGNVYRFDSAGTLLGTFGSGYDTPLDGKTLHPESILFDSSGHVFVGLVDSQLGALMEFAASGTSITTFFPRVQAKGVDWIDLASDECTLYYTSESTDVNPFSLDPASCPGTGTRFNATGLPAPVYALRILSAAYHHDVLVADGSQVVRLAGDPDGRTCIGPIACTRGRPVQTYAFSTDFNLFALNLDPDGKTFWTADIVKGDVYREDIDAGGDPLAHFKTGCVMTSTPLCRNGGLSVKGELTESTHSGKLIVKKKTVPNPDPSESTFSFTTTGALSPGTFQLKNGEQQTFDNVPPNSGYAISEAPSAGWQQAATCDSGSPTNITVAPGQTVTCTFTNTKQTPGTLIVKKATVPNPDPGGTSFAFTTGGLGGATFSLKNGETKSFTSLAPQGGYSVAETTPAGWTSASSCDNGNTATNVTIASGQTVTCTFTNTLRGKLVVKKATVPNPDPTGSIFAFTTSGLGGSSFVLKNGETRTFENLPAQGGYSVAETTSAGWILTTSCDNGSAVTNITIGAGQTVTCIFTNAQVAQPGTLVIKKVTVPNPDPAGTSFAFTTGGLGGATFSLKNGETKSFTSLAPQGGYSVAETPLAGWIGASSCDNGNAVASVTITAGQTVTCTFTNTQLGKLVIKKTTVPSPDASGTSFAFTTGGLGGAAFSLKNGEAKAFVGIAAVGGYSVAETVPAGWTGTSSCDNGNAVNSITVGVGQTVTCTFTNYLLGKLVIKKRTVPSPDPSESSFAFTTGGLSGLIFRLKDGETAGYTLTPSAGLSVAENGGGDWIVASSCDNGNGTSSIAVGAGQTVTCTFTNTATPRQLKRLARDSLHKLGALGRKQKRLVVDAIDDISASLEGGLWIDSSHLTGRKEKKKNSEHEKTFKGEDVFKNEQKAVEKLMHKDLGGVRRGSPAIRRAIQYLLDADEGLARIAIDGAASSRKKTSEARKDMTKAHKAENAGSFATAIDDYGRAWKKVREAYH